MPARYISRRRRACGCRQRYASDTRPSLLHTCRTLLVSEYGTMLRDCCLYACFWKPAHRLDAQSLVVAGNRSGADALQARKALLRSGQQLHQVLDLIAGRCRVCKALQKQCHCGRIAGLAASAASDEQQG